MPKDAEPTPGKGHNSIEVPERDFLAWLARLEEANEKVAAAQAERKKIRKQGRALGIRLTAADEALKIRDQERGEPEEHYKHVVQYADWMRRPLGFQLTLFGDGDGDAFSAAESDVEKMSAREAEFYGFTAGIKGKPMTENPHDGNTAAGQAWIKAWHDGQKAARHELPPFVAEGDDEE